MAKKAGLKVGDEGICVHMGVRRHCRVLELRGAKKDKALVVPTEGSFPRAVVDAADFEKGKKPPAPKGADE